MSNIDDNYYTVYVLFVVIMFTFLILAIVTSIKYNYKDSKEDSNESKFTENVVDFDIPSEYLYETRRIIEFLPDLVTIGNIDIEVTTPDFAGYVSAGTARRNTIILKTKNVSNRYPVNVFDAKIVSYDVSKTVCNVNVSMANELDILLLFCASLDGVDGLYYVRSFDGGATFSNPTLLVDTTTSTGYHFDFRLVKNTIRKQDIHDILVYDATAANTRLYILVSNRDTVNITLLGTPTKLFNTITQAVYVDVDETQSLFVYADDGNVYNYLLLNGNSIISQTPWIGGATDEPACSVRAFKNPSSLNFVVLTGTTLSHYTYSANTMTLVSNITTTALSGDSLLQITNYSGIEYLIQINLTTSISKYVVHKYDGVAWTSTLATLFPYFPDKHSINLQFDGVKQRLRITFTDTYNKSNVYQTGLDDVNFGIDKVEALNIVQTGTISCTGIDRYGDNIFLLNSSVGLGDFSLQNVKGKATLFTLIK